MDNPSSSNTIPIKRDFEVRRPLDEEGFTVADLDWKFLKKKISQISTGGFYFSALAGFFFGVAGSAFVGAFTLPENTKYYDIKGSIVYVVIAIIAAIVGGASTCIAKREGGAIDQQKENVMEELDRIETRCNPSPIPENEINEDIEELKKNLNIMCWEAHWHIFLLRHMQYATLPDCIDIKNTTGIHNHAKVIYHNKLDGDFIAEIKFSGEAHWLQLQSADGQDKVIFIYPSECSKDSQGIYTFQIIRKAENILFRDHSGNSTGNNIAYQDFGDPSVLMSCFIAIAIKKNKSIKLYSIKFL